MYKDIRLIISSLLLGINIIISMMFWGHIERITIFIMPLLILVILKNIEFRNLLKAVLSIAIGMIATTVGMYFIYAGILRLEEDDMGKEMDNTAVVLITDGEPVRYEMDRILKNIYKDESLFYKVFAPLKAFNHRSAYEYLGTSKYEQISTAIKNKLNYRLSMDYDVLLYHYYDEPYISDDIDRLSRNYEKIILAPISMGNTHEYDELEALINMRLINNNSTITKIPFLWQSKKLMRSMYFEIAKEIPTARAHVSGVVMLMAEDLGLYEQTIFASELTQRLVNYGIDKKAILPIVYKPNGKTLRSALSLMADKELYDVVVVNISSLENNILERETAEKVVMQYEKNRRMNIKYISGWGISNELMDEIEYEIRINNLK